MRIGRIILALLITVSVAVLPVAGSIGTVMKSTETTAMEDMDCCPHKISPCDKAIGGCSMATCALKCFTFSGALSTPIVFPSLVAQLNPVFGTIPFNSQTDSPPFRPPRV